MDWQTVTLAGRAWGFRFQAGQIEIRGLDRLTEETAARLGQTAVPAAVMLAKVLEDEISEASDPERAFVELMLQLKRPLAGDEVARADTPSYCLARAACSAKSEIRDSVARHRNTPPVTLDWLIRSESNEQVVSEAASNLSTPVETLIWLIQSKPHSKVAQMAAANANLPSEMHRALIAGSHTHAQVGVARNPRLDPELARMLYERLKGGQLLGPLRSLGRGPNTPSDILEELAELDDELMISRLLSNPNLPDSVLRKLAARRNGSSQASIARHPNASFETLRWLAESGEPSVRMLAHQRAREVQRAAAGL